MKGIYCDLTTRTFQYLHQATQEVHGSSEPFSLTGSLPLVGDMKASGFEIVLVGYGLDIVYHKPNEYCTLSFMQEGMRIMSKVIDKFEAHDRINPRGPKI